MHNDESTKVCLCYNFHLLSHVREEIVLRLDLLSWTVYREDGSIALLGTSVTRKWSKFSVQLTITVQKTRKIQHFIQFKLPTMLSMALLDDAFADRILSKTTWPPSSPNLSPPDFFSLGCNKKFSVFEQSSHSWWDEDGRHRIHSEFGPCYTEHGLREHSSACQ
jgi:hypothetical protein